MIAVGDATAEIAEAGRVGGKDWLRASLAYEPLYVAHV
jgi:hypothetical protein